MILFSYRISWQANLLNLVAFENDNTQTSGLIFMGHKVHTRLPTVVNTRIFNLVAAGSRQQVTTPVTCRPIYTPARLAWALGIGHFLAEDFDTKQKAGSR